MALPSLIGSNVIWPANSVPTGICNIDPTSGLVYSPSCANYTVINTTGTTTVASGGGLYFGALCISNGTSFTLTAYDISGTTTNTLAPQVTGTQGNQQGAPGPSGLGVRFVGALVVITTGTAGQFNCLWD